MKEGVGVGKDMGDLGSVVFVGHLQCPPRLDEV